MVASMASLANVARAGIEKCDEALGGGAAANWQQVGAGRGSYEVVGDPKTGAVLGSFGPKFRWRPWSM